MKESDPQIDLYRNYSRRAKVAAWTAGLTGLVGAASFEANSADAAPATIEQASSPESMSPKTFANYQDRLLRDLAEDIVSAPHVKVQKPTSEEQDVLNGPYKDFYFYTLIKKGSKPNHFDAIYANIDNNSPNRPLTIIAVSNADSTVLDNIRKFDRYYQYVTNDPFKKSPTSVNLEVWQQKSIHDYHAYQAGLETKYRPGEFTTTRYSKKPGLVSQKFSQFFSEARQILREH